jgi:hypothetical protein
VIFTLILIALSPTADASVVTYEVQPLYTTFSNPADYEAQPLYTTSGDPDNYVVSAPSPLDGVAMVIVETTGGLFYGGSGVLLSTGRHLLTAAHLVTDGSGALNVISARVFFDLPFPDGRVEIAGGSFIPHPDWDGDVLRGNDIAIITLAEVAPAAAQRYDLYDGTDEVGKDGTKAGYGLSGQGDTGETGAYDFGTKRSGQNKYDALADVALENWWGRTPGVDFVPGSVLQYDFDNGKFDNETGTWPNDAFGFMFGDLDPLLRDPLGLGEDEVMAALGDSGGPTFIDGKIAGIASYRERLFNWPSWYDSPDVNGWPDSSFGEFGSDTRVSFYADWIRAVIPEPSSIIVWSLLSGLAVAAGFRRSGRR